MSPAAAARGTRTWEGDSEEQEAPVFKVVSGDPSPEELAALTACLLATTSQSEEEPEAPTRNDLVREAIKRGRQFMQLPGIWRGRH